MYGEMDETLLSRKISKVLRHLMVISLVPDFGS